MASWNILPTLFLAASRSCQSRSREALKAQDIGPSEIEGDSC